MTDTVKIDFAGTHEKFRSAAEEILPSLTTPAGAGITIFSRKTILSYTHER